MRLHVLSDLHLEQRPALPPAIDADVIVLAGDIGTGTGGIQWAQRWSGGRDVLYLAGNHEFYGHALPDLINELRDSAAGTSVHVLENDELILGGVRFLGCTLWSDFEFDGRARRAASMAACEQIVNDYRLIRFGTDRRALGARDTLAVHEASRGWLAERLAQPYNGPTVVITHHAPVIQGRPPEPELRALAGAFASDLTQMMGHDRVALWIFGHTHRRADLVFRGTRVVSNPLGYPHQLVDGFDPGCVVDLDDGPPGSARAGK